MNLRPRLHRLEERLGPRPRGSPSTPMAGACLQSSGCRLTIVDAGVLSTRSSLPLSGVNLMAKILVVDDSLVDRTLVAGLLSKRPGLTAVEKATGLMLVVASTGREALASIAQDMPDLVVTDLQMPEMNGLELVQAVKSQYPSLPV